MKRRRFAGLFVALAIVAAASALVAHFHRPFPSDQTPEGAYMRIARNVMIDHVEEVFPYLETEAQWASFTIHDMRAAAYARIEKSYPEERRQTELASLRPWAAAKDGSDVFRILAKERGWTTRLRKDLSGVVTTEVVGERASVVTARGTRYPFHKRENGIWGLTIFTADLLAESDKATRDLAAVKAAAEDYDRVRAAGSQSLPKP